MMIALVTWTGQPFLTEDDTLLVKALHAHRFEAIAAPWDDLSVTWKAFDAVVIRSAWNYHLQFSSFQAWVSDLEREGIPVFNPTSILRWNADKRYLLDLQCRGVRIPATFVIEQSRRFSLREKLERHCWSEAVVKPVISASAHETYRVGIDAADEFQSRTERLTYGGDLLIQAFVPEIQSCGETSLIFIDGAFSHAVIKKPAQGDFRVQEEYGGMAERIEADQAMVAFGYSILARIEAPLLYARVDVVNTAAGLVLMELELIEPYLYLSLSASAASRFAAALVKRLT